MYTSVLLSNTNKRREEERREEEKREEKRRYRTYVLITPKSRRE